MENNDKTGTISLILAFILAITMIILVNSCVTKKTMHNYHKIKTGVETDTLRQTKLILNAK